ncbi:MAG: MetQ/NlpA family ABC transporter substrate-binding protein [Succinivibrio sp.]
MSAQTEIKVGVLHGDTAPWEYIREDLKKENIKITIVEFNDFFTPNRALAEGSIDLNAFQHRAFLNQEIAEHGYKLVPICLTYLDPIGMYSKKIRSVSELKNSDTIVIPSDPSNGGRALLVLEAEGIIKTSAAKGEIPDVTDITENPLNLRFEKVNPADTVFTLDEKTAAFVNGNYAFENGFIANRDAVIREKLSTEDLSTPFVKVLVARAEDAHRAEFAKVIRSYQSKGSASVLKEAEGGALIPAFSY